MRRVPCLCCTRYPFIAGGLIVPHATHRGGPRCVASGYPHGVFGDTAGRFFLLSLIFAW